MSHLATFRGEQNGMSKGEQPLGGAHELLIINLIV